MLAIVLFFLGILIASAVCSMVEAAMLSLPFVRARILLEQGQRGARDLIYVKENLTLAISSLVIINNAINIAGSIFFGQIVAHHLGDAWLGAFSAILTFAIIILGEIIPKTFGERYKIAVSLITAKPLKYVMVIFRPLVRGLMRLAESMVRAPKYPRVSEDEIRIMLSIGRDAGTVEIDEEVLCNRVFKLNDMRAHQIMKPFNQIYSIPAGSRLGDVREEILGSLYSRIVVYENSPANIVGVVQRSILLKEIACDNDEAMVRDFMMRPIFVADTALADTLLAMFQKYHQHLFIVQDSSGNDIGLVTMEDVLEELFGEIYDEKDMEMNAMRAPKGNGTLGKGEKR